MCGIIGVASHREIADILLQGLNRLEYRGYDSAGIATINPEGALHCHRVAGKVSQLQAQIIKKPMNGNIGIAHNRWATHGIPNEVNAHPHCIKDEIAVVHNGIIENYIDLKNYLALQGATFYSETDTEILPWLLDYQLKKEPNFLKAIQAIIPQLSGSFSILFLLKKNAHSLIAIRQNSPLVIGLGQQENFIASDSIALLPFTKNFIHLEDGDIAEISANHIAIYNQQGQLQYRPVHHSNINSQHTIKGDYQYYMHKEIKEQPQVVKNALAIQLPQSNCSLASLGLNQLPFIQQIHIVACGSSYHAALMARYWLEKVGFPCQVDIASEFRYRHVPIPANTLLIMLSQSGETADTLGALRTAKKTGQYSATLAICNIVDSSLARACDFLLPTYTGPEVSVAATKSFTTQLITLFLFTIGLSHQYNKRENDYLASLRQLHCLPQLLEETLKIEPQIEKIARQWIDKKHSLLIARGEYYPLALEGALKLKEIAYLHAEAYPAGELKHGALALLSDEIPVIVLAPQGEQLAKLQANIQEILARNGKLLIFYNENLALKPSPNIEMIQLPKTPFPYFNPFLYTIPLQYLAYHIACLKGINVDQPRHLAKSVTVD